MSRYTFHRYTFSYIIFVHRLFWYIFSIPLPWTILPCYWRVPQGRVGCTGRGRRGGRRQHPLCQHRWSSLRTLIGSSGSCWSSLSFYLFVALSICLSLFLSVCRSFYLFVALSIRLSLFLSVCHSFFPFVALSVCRPFYPYVTLSVCFSLFLLNVCINFVILCNCNTCVIVIHV